MTRLVLVLLLGASACTAPAEAPRDAPASAGTPASFDAAAWLARARPSAVASVVEPAVDASRLEAARARAAELDAAVGWTTACRTFWDPEAQRQYVKPALADGGPFLRGTYAIADVGGGSVVAVTCGDGTFQGSFALVHIVGHRAALLETQIVDSDGEPFGPQMAVNATPSFEGSATFTTFALGRGLGDCGTLSTYRITGFGSTDLVEARMRNCDDRRQDAPPPQEWPVIHPR